jgi:hypothetical protein
VDLPIEQVASWAWEAGAEPPIPENRSWMQI